MAVTVFSQEKVSNYYSSYFDESYSIHASYKKDKLCLLIQVHGENTWDNVKFYIDGETNITSFIKALEQSKEKFAEWSTIAKQNKVKSFDKDFDIAFPIITICWSAGDWKFDFCKKLNPRFVVTSSGDCVFVITGTATASDNKYIEQEYYFALSTILDFTLLLNEIQIEKLKSHFEAKTDLETLFQ